MFAILFFCLLIYSFVCSLPCSCDPNCASCFTVIDGRHSIALRALRYIEPGEELTQDYNCVTESLDEFRAAVCLCGTASCRGSFLYHTGAQSYVQLIDRHYTTLHRLAVLFYVASEPAAWMVVNSATARQKKKGGGKRKSKSAKANAASVDAAAATGAAAANADPTYSDLEQLHVDVLKQNGVGQSALDGLPAWLRRYAAVALQYTDFERRSLVRQLRAEVASSRGEEEATAALPPTPQPKRKRSRNKTAKTTAAAAAAAAETALAAEDEQRPWYEVQAQGVAEQRLANLIITLSQVGRRLSCRLEPGGGRVYSRTVPIAGGAGAAAGGGALRAPPHRRATSGSATPSR